MKDLPQTMDMQPFSNRAFPLVSVLVLVGCGQSHGVGPESDASVAEDASSLDAGPPAPSCLDACRARLEDDTRGWCPLEDCPAACARVAGMSAEANAALETCLRDNPLCFETLDGCVLGSLYGELAVAEVGARGEGFEALEGQPVVLELQLGPDRVRRETVVADGRFEVSFGPQEVMVRSSLPLVFGYVDTDADGGCTSVDERFNLFTERVGSFDDPRYEVRFEGAQDPARVEGVCTRFEG